MGSCLLVGSIENDPGHPVREHFAEQRVIEYSEADYGASVAAVEESAAAAAVGESAAAAAATAVENV